MTISLVAARNDLHRTGGVFAVHRQVRAFGGRGEHDASVFHRPRARQKVEGDTLIVFLQPVLRNQRSPTIRTEHLGDMGIAPFAPLTFKVFSRGHVHLPFEG